MNYISDTVAITGLLEPDTYAAGDYLALHGDAGSGTIDYDLPLGPIRLPYEAFGAVRGWGSLSWGRFPWGHGFYRPELTYAAQTPGLYQFAMQGYDRIGNLNEGTPAVASTYIDLVPVAPLAGPAVTAYDGSTLTLSL